VRSRLVRAFSVVRHSKLNENIVCTVVSLSPQSFAPSPTVPGTSKIPTCTNLSVKTLSTQHLQQLSNVVKHHEHVTRDPSELCLVTRDDIRVFRYDHFGRFLCERSGSTLRSYLFYSRPIWCLLFSLYGRLHYI
jgi:hypothetical protein